MRLEGLTWRGQNIPCWIGHAMMQDAKGRSMYCTVIAMHRNKEEEEVEEEESAGPGLYSMSKVAWQVVKSYGIHVDMASAPSPNRTRVLGT